MMELQRERRSSLLPQHAGPDQLRRLDAKKSISLLQPRVASGGGWVIHDQPLEVEAATKLVMIYVYVLIVLRNRIGHCDLSLFLRQDILHLDLLALEYQRLGFVQR